MQKKAIRILNASVYCHEENEVFLKLRTLKCCHLVELRTALTLNSFHVVHRSGSKLKKQTFS